jgi:two-component system response regulator YesN
VDYLGKLFKKETGRNFSHYVMEKRMEIAKRSILEGSTDKIYEVAAKVGYGTNSQYFSQVFKKYTGVSPLEYKEYARSIRKSPEELHIA